MMPVTVHCPECERSWVLEESGGGGEFVCPSCLARISLEVPVPVGVAAPIAPAMQERAPIPLSDRASSATAAETAPAARPDEEVICPRCQLHFYPRGKSSAPSKTKRCTVLVVEDQEYFRQIASDALETGYDVKTAGGSVEARQILAQGGIDLLVLDLTLGGGDEGEQLLRGLTPKPCPILIFTAQDESELYGERWEELSRCGADDLVMKGMHVGESLRRKVGALLGQPLEDDDRS